MTPLPIITAIHTFTLMPENAVLGIDFGRVIQGGADPDTGRSDTVFLGGTLEEAVNSPATPGMWPVVSGLVSAFGGRVFIISKCGTTVQNKTRKWLEHNEFHEQTGLPRANVRFVRKRADKAPVCRELGVTHMIDDRLGVHRAIYTIVPNRYLFGPQEGHVPDWVVHTPTWASVADAIATAREGQETI
jgi:hypothetical protein